MKIFLVVFTVVVREILTYGVKNKNTKLYTHFGTYHIRENTVRPIAIRSELFTAVKIHV
jgi:hypothetical protein